MRFDLRSPALLLAAFIVAALAATVATVLVAASRPALSGVAIAIRPGALPVVHADGADWPLIGLVTATFPAGADIQERSALEAFLAARPDLGIAFEPPDFVEDPDMLPDYAAIDRFYARQGIVTRLLDADRVTLVRSAGVGTDRAILLPPVTVERARGMDRLPASFWLQISAGLVVILVAAVFLALRPRSFAVSAFAFAGLGITGSAYCAAIYSTRLLGMDPGLIHTLSLLNHFFTASFGVGIIGLFSVYPVRIAAPAKTVPPAAVLSYGALGAYHLQLLPHDVVSLQNVVGLLLLAILVAVFLQFRATGGRPADRAALIWLGASVVTGSTAFVALVILPVALGREGLVTQASGFILLAMIYVGIAFAVARYRLFDISRWSYRILIYAGMIVSLLALDIAFILGLQFSEQASLAVASLIILAIYFPLRDRVQDRLFGRSEQNLPDLYRQAVATAYRFTPTERRDAWRRLLGDAFRPGHVEPLAEAPDTVAVRNEGIEMVLPAYPWSEPLALGFAAQGRRLFGTQDIRLVEELAEIAAAAHADRLSYERGAEEERHRIARDLHDDVGSTLLSGLHAVDESRRQETLVEALSDIRRIAHDLAGRELSMERLIAQLRHDMRQRAGAQDRAFEWPLGSADEDHTVLPYRFHHNLSAMIREAVTNALKHGKGTIRIRANIEDAILRLAIANDDAPSSGVDAGIGLDNIRARAAELGGHAESQAGEGTFQLEITVPMPRART